MKLEDYLAEFKVIRTFKETGQKRVFLGEHGRFGKIIVKVAIYESPIRLERAKREVEIQKTIDSSYYPKIIGFEVFPDYRFIIIEEFIDSHSLTNCFKRFNQPINALLLLRELVTGLILLWEKDIVHRDIKPDNILIRSDNSPVIIDLGIVLALNKTALTHPLALRGPCTPAYSAPEQLKNRRAYIDHRTDQFILGIDFIQMLLGGSHPFDPRTLNVGESIEFNIINNNWYSGIFQRKELLPISELAFRLLAPEPYMRYKNFYELFKEINNCIEAYK